MIIMMIIVIMMIIMIINMIILIIIKQQIMTNLSIIIIIIAKEEEEEEAPGQDAKHAQWCDSEMAKSTQSKDPPSARRGGRAPRRCTSRSARALCSIV